MYLTSEETGKKTVGAVYLDHIFYGYKLSILLKHVAGSVDGTVPVLTNAWGDGANWCTGDNRDFDERISLCG